MSDLGFDDDFDDSQFHSNLVCNTRDELLKELKAHYLKRGVVLTTKKSNFKKLKSRGVETSSTETMVGGYVVLKCDRGGVYASQCKPGRKSSSRVTGCAFEIVCSAQKGEWKVRKVRGNHNHEISSDLSGHSVVRRPNEIEKETILALSRNGTAPRFILSYLKKELNNHYITERDVYNVLAKERRRLSAGPKPLELLANYPSGSDNNSNLEGNTPEIAEIPDSRQSLIEELMNFINNSGDNFYVVKARIQEIMREEYASMEERLKVKNLTSSSRNQNSTTPNQSSTSRKCGHCGQSGHTTRTCSQKPPS